MEDLFGAEGGASYAGGGGGGVDVEGGVFLEFGDADPEEAFGEVEVEFLFLGGVFLGVQGDAAFW